MSVLCAKNKLDTARLAEKKAQRLLENAQDAMYSAEFDLQSAIKSRVEAEALLSEYTYNEDDLKGYID